MHDLTLAHLTDAVLLRNLAALVAQDRLTSAALLAYIAEVDARRLYAPAGYSSMHAYCVGELRLSEDAAYKRIQAGRVGRQFPEIFTALADGRLHLAAVCLIAPYLTPENVDELVAAATHRRKSDVEVVLARRFSVPVIVWARIRPIVQLAPGQVEVSANPNQLALGQVENAPPNTDQLAPGQVESPDQAQKGSGNTDQLALGQVEASPNDPLRPTQVESASMNSNQLAPGQVENASPDTNQLAPGQVENASPNANQLAPGQVGAGPPGPGTNKNQLAPGQVARGVESFLVQVRIAKSTEKKLRYAQALLSHTVPAGDVAQVLDRALDALITQLEKRKIGSGRQPRPAEDRGGVEEAARDTAQQPHSDATRRRYIPAQIRRAVWERDQGQCTFVNAAGNRCEETRFLEFDHVEPLALGGKASEDGLRLRCRAHNQYEAERAFGADFMRRKRREARLARAAARADAADEAGQAGDEAAG